MKMNDGFLLVKYEKMENDIAQNSVLFEGLAIVSFYFYKKRL